MIPFGDYTPDQPEYANPGATVMKNVIPRTVGSYTPLGSMSSVSDALTARCQGAASVRDSGGGVATFAGDATKLYKLGGTSFSDVSGATYTIASDETWEYCIFGQNVLATNIADNIQSYVLGTSAAFADLGGSPPKARHIAVIKDFVMVGNTNDGVDGNVPNRVWWCAINDPTDWPTIGSVDAARKQSDRQDLPYGGWVQAITGAVGGADGAIFMDSAIYRIQYEGPPTVFGFYEVERERGTPAPNSIINVGPAAFYLGEDGFYLFNGASSQSIGGQRVDKTFFNDLDQNYFDRIYGSADPVNKVAMWAYPGAGNSGGNPNKYLAYNWAVDRWSHGEFDSQLIFRDLSAGVDADSADGYGTVDSIAWGPDSRVWTGGRLLLAGFDTDNKLARFTGSALAATMETAEVGAGELFGLPNNRIYVNGIRPYVDGGTITVGLKYRDLPTDSITTDGPNAVDPNGVAHFTRSTRYGRAQVNVAAGGTWTHAQGVDYDAQLDGEI